MKKKLDVEKLSPEEVQKELLKISILSVKRLKSIDNIITFFLIMFIISLIFKVLS